VNEITEDKDMKLGEFTVSNRQGRGLLACAAKYRERYIAQIIEYSPYIVPKAPEYDEKEWNRVLEELTVYNPQDYIYEKSREMMKNDAPGTIDAGLPDTEKPTIGLLQLAIVYRRNGFCFPRKGLKKRQEISSDRQCS
jgi:hypothetical protein